VESHPIDFAQGGYGRQEKQVLRSAQDDKGIKDDKDIQGGDGGLAPRFASALWTLTWV
jgi:hypothetical protein